MRKIDSKLEFTAKEWADMPTFLAMSILKRWKIGYDVSAAPGVEMGGKLREWMIGTMHLHFPDSEVNTGIIAFDENDLHKMFVELACKLSPDFKENLNIRDKDSGEPVVERFDDWTVGQVFFAKHEVFAGLTKTGVIQAPSL